MTEDGLKSMTNYGRRSRPRARSVDSSQSPYHSGSESSANRSTDSLFKECVDVETPLISKNFKKSRPLAYYRSCSLDCDPKYRFIVYQSSFSLMKYKAPHKQNSLVTIFAIWNTIVGSSLLAMPWAIEKSGLFLALILMFSISTLAVYTAYRILTVQLSHGKMDIGEVPYLCSLLLGAWAETISRIISFTIIFGANIIYWILMSNFLYHTVGYFTDLFFGLDPVPRNNNQKVLCPKEMAVFNSTNDSLEANAFQRIWNLNLTVPIFLAIIVGPLLNFRSATFFTKFNSVGTLSVLYLLVFVVVKSVDWGVNLNVVDATREDYTSLFKPTFFAMSGMLPLSLFIHNIVITLMRNNRHQGHNGRDLSIAYILVVVTYLLIGVIFYVCFPLKKSCIEDNMLNNFPNWDVMTVIARIFLFFQLLTVFPLLSYMLRVQIFSALNYPAYPGRMHVVVLNLINVLACVAFAIFLPHIGMVIRYTGAICGFVYIFTLPNLLYVASQRENLSKFSVVFHSFIPVLGFVNVVGQFFVSE